MAATSITCGSVNSITCESVSEAHKRCEEIVASVMNACLEQDPGSKAYSEPITKHNIVIPHIRIETQAKINFREVVEDSKHRRGLKRCASIEQEIEQYKANGKDKGDDKDKDNTNIGGADPKHDKEGDTA